MTVSCRRPRSSFRRNPLFPVLCLVLALTLTGCSVSVRSVDAQPTASPVDTERSTSIAFSGTPEATPTATHSPAPPATTPTTPPAPTPTPQSVVNQPVHTPQPAQPTPTPIPPTPTAIPTPSGPPQCANVPVRGFGLLWNDQPAVAKEVGCPQSTEVGLAARVQPFEDGMMVWLDTVNSGVDTWQWVLTLVGSTATRYRVPANGPTWVNGAVQPSGSFKWVWDNVYTAKQQLGDPVDTWYDSDAAMQVFDSGTMIWLKAPPDDDKPMIYVVDADLFTASTGSYQVYPDLSAQ